MGTALTGLQIGSTYNGLLKTTDNAVINGTLRVITDGLGNNTALEVSTAGVKSSGTLDVTGVATLGAGAILNTPASGNLANCTGYVGTSALVTTGALNSGSITSGFGSIDVGADSITGGAISGTTGNFSGATSISTNDTAFRGRESSGNYRSLVKVNASNVIEIGDANNTNTVPVATDAASLSVAGTVFSGGVAITKKLYVGDSIVGAAAISGTTGTLSTSALVSNNSTSLAHFPSSSTRIGSSWDGQNIFAVIAYGATNTAIQQGVAGGTKASPTATPISGALAIWSGVGYDTTTGWGNGSGTASARINFVAAENYTNTAQGSYITFDVTPPGSTVASRAEVARLTSTGLAVTGTVSTTDPAGGAGPAWKLGVAASVSPTSPNRTIRIDIGGTSYYLHAKTTND